MNGADTLSVKSWSTRVALAALAGYALWRTDPSDGVQRFFIGRHGLVWPLPSIDDVDAFLERAGAPA